MNVLIACEESQVICKEFRKKGHNSFSCDIQECSGGHPEWHINDDVLPLLNGNCKFKTMDNSEHILYGNWDIIIAHPPCTYMSKAGARFMYPTAGNLDVNRLAKAFAAKEFFFKFYNCNCPKIAIENPTPLKVVGLPKETQVIQPYEFGEHYSKRTLLWLKGLEPLKPTNVLSEYVPFLPSNTGGFSRGRGGSKGVVHNSKAASKTFIGIAIAMAEQWG